MKISNLKKIWLKDPKVKREYDIIKETLDMVLDLHKDGAIDQEMLLKTLGEIVLAVPKHHKASISEVVQQTLNGLHKAGLIAGIEARVIQSVVLGGDAKELHKLLNDEEQTMIYGHVPPYAELDDLTKEHTMPKHELDDMREEIKELRVAIDKKKMEVEKLKLLKQLKDLDEDKKRIEGK